MKKLSLYFLSVFLFLANGRAQQLQLTNYSPREGVPVYGVNSIFQDSKGWMWFTTGYEVMRYDGHRFRIWPRAANTPMNFCFRIREVNKEIWIMAAPYTLKVSGDSLRKVEYINNAGDAIDHVLQKGESYFLGKDGVYRMIGDDFKPYITDASLSVNSPNSLITFNDSLLISCQERERLIIFNINQKRFYAVNIPITDIQTDQKKNVFLLVRGKGIMRLKQITINDNVPVIAADPVVVFHEPKYTTFIVDGQGSFWTVNQFTELVKLGPGKERRTFNESDGLPSLWFNEMFVDREKNLWICFNSGLCKIRTTNWERYTIGEALYSNHILFLPMARVGTKNSLEHRME